MNNELSKTEREVIALKCRGLHQKEIAEIMCRSPHTIRTHFEHIYEKLNIHNEIELINQTNTTKP